MGTFFHLRRPSWSRRFTLLAAASLSALTLGGVAAAENIVVTHVPLPIASFNPCTFEAFAGDGFLHTQTYERMAADGSGGRVATTAPYRFSASTNSHGVLKSSKNSRAISPSSCAQRTPMTPDRSRARPMRGSFLRKACSPLRPREGASLDEWAGTPRRAAVHAVPLRPPELSTGGGNDNPQRYAALSPGDPFTE